VSTYGYDPNTGELVSQSYSDGTPSVGYTYNRQGKMATITDATGTRTLGYDPNHPWRFSTETLSAYFGSDVLTRLYASSGVLGRVNGFQLGSAGGSNSVLEQDYGFTSDGRFSTITSSSNGNEYSRTFQYFYLPNSALVQGLAVSGDNPFSISRTFETQRDYLTSVQTNWSSTVEVDYAYITNALGQREFRTESGQAFADYGNSLTRSYTYDGRGELITAPEYLGTSAGTNPMPGRQDSYNYDNFGNRTSVSRLSGGAVAETYTPNALNQYSTKENNDVPVAGTADPNANIAVQGTTAMSAARQGRFWEAEVGVANSTSPWAGYLPIYVGKTGAGPGGTDLAQINTRWAQLGEVTQSFSYDNDGNLTNDGVWTYTWDAENRLIQMQPTSLAVSSGVPNYLLVFTYDYLGRRVQKRVTNLANGGSEVNSRRFVYDGWNLVAEYTAPGGTTFGVAVRTYTWGLDIARSMKDAGGVGALVQIADQASAKTYLPGYDGNGNIAVLINGDTGALAADYQYDPFGQLLRSDELDQAIYGQPFRFSTKFEDIETSLIYYGHRYSSPSMGRFINRDPIEESGGLNLYVFCGNDGINRWDVLGNNPIIGDEGRFESSSLGGAGGGAAIIGAKGGAAFFNYAINEGNEATGDSELNMGGSDASSLASQQNEAANDQEATATQEAVSQAQSAAIVANLNASLNPGTDAAGAQADAEAGAQLSAWANQSDDTSSASVSAVAASEPSDPPSPPDPAGLSTAPGTQGPQGTVTVGPSTVISDYITGSTANLTFLPGAAANDAVGSQTVGILNSAIGSGQDVIVSLGYTNVSSSSGFVGPGNDGTGPYHTYTLISSLSTGQEYIERGGPGGSNQSAMMNGDGTLELAPDDAWGSILARGRTWTEAPGSFDNPSNTVSLQPVGSISGSFSSAQNTLENLGSEINATGIGYFPLGPNSNSVTYTIISNLGLNPTPIHSVPGWGMQIPVDGGGG
jgi:RHS repeat-associated protein